MMPTTHHSQTLETKKPGRINLPFLPILENSVLINLAFGRNDYPSDYIS